MQIRANGAQLQQPNVSCVLRWATPASAGRPTVQAPAAAISPTAAAAQGTGSTARGPGSTAGGGVIGSALGGDVLVVTPATLASSPLGADGGVIRCVAPPTGRAGPVTVSVASGSAALGGVVLYDYVDEPSIQSMHPQSGPLGGGTRVSIVADEPLPRSHVFFCHFQMPSAGEGEGEGEGEGGSEGEGER